MRPNPGNLKGLLLDMDGTLVDHTVTLARCFQFAARTLGQREPTRTEIKRSIGGSMPITIQKFLPPEKVEAGKTLWRQRFEELHLEGVTVLPGAQALLEHCYAESIKAAVFTNKSGRHTRAILDNEGLSDRIQFALGAEDTPHRKPEPEFSKIALERLELPAKSVGLVGDSPFDVEAALCVGMVSLCVTTGSHSRKELQDAGAHKVFDSLYDLVDWLKG